MHRRRFLTIGAATLLAGCSGDDDQTGDGSSDADPEPTATQTETATPPPDPAFTGAATDIGFFASYLPDDEAWRQENHGEWTRCTNADGTVRVSGRAEVHQTVPEAIDTYDELVADLGDTEELESGDATVVSPGTGIAIGVMRLSNALSEIRATWVEEGTTGSLTDYVSTALRNQADAWEAQVEE